MRILFILPYDNTYKYKGNFTRSISYAPLTLSVLAALVPVELNADIKIVDEGVDKPFNEGEFDIVAITCVASSSKRAYWLCNYWKNKGSYVILGGVHPTLMPEEAANHGDSIFVGFAEDTFPEFIKDFIDGVPKKYYYHTPDCQNLSMPLPRRDLLSKKYMGIPTVVANRGCKNNCKYCSIHSLWGHNGLARPIDEVIYEIKNLNKKRIILLDPSLTSDEIYAKEFFKALIPLNIKWSGLSTIDVVRKPEVFDLMVKSGCEGILAGFESINNESLILAEKSTNKVNEYKYAVKQFHDRDIPVLGCFVAGFDGDTKNSLMSTIDFIDEVEIDIPRFSILTPFPGTSLFDDYEKDGRIITRDWEMYDTMHVVFKPKNFSPEELYQIFCEMWKKSYRLKSILKRVGFTRREKIIRLGTNLGFKYYAGRLTKEGVNT